MSEKIKNDLMDYLYPMFIDDVDYTVSKQYNDLLSDSMQSDDIAKIMSEATGYSIICYEDYYYSNRAYVIKVPFTNNFEVFEQNMLKALEKNSKLKRFYESLIFDKDNMYVGFIPDTFNENPFVADRKKAFAFFKDRFDDYMTKKGDKIEELYNTDDEEFDTMVDDFLDFIRDVAIENNFGDIFTIKSEYSKLVKLFFDTVLFVAKKSK